MMSRVSYTVCLRRTLCRLLLCIGALFPAAYAPAQGQVLTTQQELPSFSNTQTDTTSILAFIDNAIEVSRNWPDSALVLFHMALAESRTAGFPEGMQKALHHLAIQYMNRGMYEKSLAAFREAQILCSQTEGMQDRLPFIYNCMGNIYQVLGNYEQAISHYYQAMVLCEKLSVVSSGGIYDNLGSMLLQLRQYKQALYYLDKAEQMALERKNYEVLGFILADKSILMKSQKDLDKSISYAETAVYLGRKYKYKLLLQVALTNLGSIYIAKGMPREALPYLLEAQTLTEGIDLYYRNMVVEALGKAYYDLHQYHQAEYYLNKALMQAEASNISSGLADIHYMLATVYEAMGQYKQALAAYKRQTLLRDSVANQKVTENVTQLEVKYRTAEKDKELSRKQMLIMQQERRLEKKNIWIIGVAAGLLVLGTLLIALNRIYQHKSRLQQEQIQNFRQEQEILQLRATVEGGEKERNRIARELHDGIMVQFSAVKMNLSVLPNQYGVLQDAEPFGKIIEQLDNATAELRRTAHRLMPDMLVEKGLVEAVHFFCKSLNLGSRLNIIFQHYGDFPPLPPALELSMYRVIQELVQNIIKHAQATQALVQLSYRDQLLCITVEDNGIGISSATQTDNSGMGLKYIRNHVAALKGHMDIMPHQKQGTIVYIEIDMQKQQELSLVASSQ